MGLIMTEQGRGLVAEAMTEEVAIQFTRLVASDTTYTKDDAGLLETIENPKQEVAITEVEKTDETTVTVAVTMDNMDLTEGYYIRCIGVYAKGSSDKEILFGVAIVEENPDYMPMFVGQTVSGIEYKFYINVGNAENVLIEVNPDNFVTFEKYDKLEATVDGLKETIDGLKETVQNELSTTLDGKYDKTGGTISGNVEIAGGLKLNNSFFTLGPTTLHAYTQVATWTGDSTYNTSREAPSAYSCIETPYALVLQSSKDTESYYDKTGHLPIHLVTGNRQELTRGLLVYGDKIIYNNEELATKTDVQAATLTVINNLTSTSTTAPLSAYQGNVLNGKIPSVVNSLTSTSTTSALSAYQGKVLSDKVSANGGVATYDDTTKSTTCGSSNTLTGNYSTAVGYNNILSGVGTKVMGYNNIACGTVIGSSNTTTTGSVFGASNEVKGLYSYVVGQNNTVGTGESWSGQETVTLGGYNTNHALSGNVLGKNNTMTAGNLCLGRSNTVSSSSANAIGENLTSNVYSCTVIGSCNGDLEGNTSSYAATNDMFAVGIGYNNFVFKNGLRIKGNGYVYGGTYNSSGADYAEYFEWLDGNPSDEDRIGRFVTIRQGKIQLANADDTYIVGVISGNGSIIGDAQEDEWSGRFEKDIFGRVICEWQDVEHIETELVEDENGEMVEVEKTVVRNEYHMKKNPEMDNDVKYIPRSERSEWDVVGLMGKLIVIDDGTCAVDGFCSVGKNGMATDGDKYLVLE